MLIDMNMPVIGGLEDTRKIVCFSPNIKVIMLTIYTENPLPIKILQAGASGYLSKASAPREVICAIRVVNAGKRYIASDIDQQMALSKLEVQTKTPFKYLSERELQIMLMIPYGQKFTDISVQLNLISKTVNIYHYRIFSKLNISCGDVE